MRRVQKHIARTLALFALCLLCACKDGEADAAAQAPSQPVKGPQQPQAERPTEGTCGKRGQPDCPLQGWMKANLQSQLRAKDYPRLQAALDQLADTGGVPYDDWASIAKAGAAAAGEQDMSGVRAACKHCHDSHRDAFRSAMRTATAVVPD